MDGVGAGDFRRADDRRHVQVAVGAARRADADVLVGEADVQRVLVGLRVDGHGLDAELPARKMIRSAISPRFAIRIFLNIIQPGSQAHRAVLMANSRSPYCTGWPFST